MQTPEQFMAAFFEARTLDIQRELRACAPFRDKFTNLP
jgi:hypothetical protein